MELSVVGLGPVAGGNAAVEAQKALDVLLEQERALRYDRFGSHEALLLGETMVGLSDAFGETCVIEIVREPDRQPVFLWVPDDKGERSLRFA